MNMNHPTATSPARITLLLFSLLCLCLTSCKDYDPLVEDWRGNLPAPTSADETFGGGEGTAASPYIIASPQHLAQLASNVNAGISNYEGKTFRLSNDIILSGFEWTPIGISMRLSFRGSFDGGGHAVRGMSIKRWKGENVGLFGFLHNATVSNLTVEGDISAAYENCAMIAGVANASTFTSCKAEGTIEHLESNGEFYSEAVGGICGKANTSAVFRDCENAAYAESLIYAAYAGGICGRMTQPDYATKGYIFENCRNSGNLQASYCGGICGWLDDNFAQDGDSPYMLSITRCTNTGTVISPRCAGGILGGTSLLQIYQQPGEAGSGDFDEFLENNKPYLAALIDQCRNSGKITSFAGKQYAYLAGIAAYAMCAHITNSYSDGIIECPEGKKSFKAGLVANSVFFNRIEHCYFLTSPSSPSLQLFGSQHFVMNNEVSKRAEIIDCWTDSDATPDTENCNGAVQKFSETAWPTFGAPWASSGSWNGGSPVYPTLSGQ